MQKTLELYLIRVTLEIITGIIRLLLFLLLTPVALFLRLIECLIRFKNTKSFFPEKNINQCPSLPEPIVRRPDPCIYSQFLLHAQGLPFTMVNPDIWYFEPASPNVINPPLQADRDYTIQARVHNATTDPALGVRVLAEFTDVAFYFAGPELIPVKSDALGRTVYRFIDIGPMSSAIVTFDWHTPDNQLGSSNFPFAIRVTLEHPMDVNPENNVGIHSILTPLSASNSFSPGNNYDIELPVQNPFSEETTFQFHIDRYAIDAEIKVQLKPVVKSSYARRSLSSRLANIHPTVVAKRSTDKRHPMGVQLSLRRQPDRQLTRARYEGFEELRNTILSRDYSLPQEIIISLEGKQELRQITMAPGEQGTIKLTLSIPADLEFDKQLPVNISMQTSKGTLFGGTSFLIIEGIVVE